MDNYLNEHLTTLTCHEMFELKNDFYKSVELLCGSTDNLTGITELLIYRFMYHALNMTNPIINKAVQNGDIYLLNGHRYHGINGRYQVPDIVIEQSAEIKYVISIKNMLSYTTPTKHEKISPLVKELTLINGRFTSAIQDIFRIENIRHGLHSHFNSLTIVFSKASQKLEQANKLIEEAFEWHKFLILEDNHKPLLTEIINSLHLNFKNSFV